MVSLFWQAPIGIRLWRYVRENAKKKVVTFITIASLYLDMLSMVRNHKEQTNLGLYLLQKGIFIDPFAKRNVTSSHGIPVGGVG
jgi:non-lysosomal glucosylceramidase